MQASWDRWTRTWSLNTADTWRTVSNEHTGTGGGTTATNFVDADRVPEPPHPARTSRVAPIRSAAATRRASAILDEFVEVAVGRPEVNVALSIVLGWIIDRKSGRSELDDRVVEVLDKEPEGTIGITHAMRIRDSEVRSVRECVQVGLNTADKRAPEAEDVFSKDGHLGAMLRRSSGKHQPE